MVGKDEKRTAVGSGSSNMDSKRPLTSGRELDRAHLQELINLVLETAKAKGWDAEVDNQDAMRWRFATVAVSRVSSGTYQNVTAIFEITCDERVRISATGTSFYSYGVHDLNKAVQGELLKLPWVAPVKKTVQMSDALLLERFLRRFHSVVRQLKNRHHDRPVYAIRDEYDVQDLLHAVLRGLFDDVRAEEYVPSYAGGASRIDFLVKSEGIAVEIKFASSSLRDKQIGEQILIDIGRYQSHPDCHHLICFVYDPNGFLKNPSGLEKDLSRAEGKPRLTVIVVSP